MGAADMIRLNREDCKRTKHDSAFSHWKILIGPNDWEDYLSGKEGAERYRTHNLPNSTSCPGVYELGIAVSRRQAGREANRLDPDFIVPVYVGKSDNVRTRLQRYGREGAHLENGFSGSELHAHENVYGPKRSGLFTEIFSRGFSIVYRWTPRNDNKDAEGTEAQLLDRFDYAWNKGSNGVRRHNDVLRKLDGISRATPLPAFIRKLQLSLEKQKGIRIKVCDPLLLENGSDFHVKSTNFLPQILKFGRSRPRIVSRSFGANGDPNTICGVALSHGSVCIRPPITGNKRCAEHKGMKVNGLSSKLIAEGNESIRPCETRGEENASICGFVLDNGSPCARKPFQRNKRCLEHKGRRNRGFISQPVTDRIGQWTHDPILEYRTYSSNDSQTILSSKANAQYPQDFSGSFIHQNHNVICGVQLSDGSFCTRQPAVGRKRCEEHKGMRVKEPISKQLGAEIPSVLTGSTARISGGKKHWNMDIPPVNRSPTCGATLRNGSFCSRKLSEVVPIVKGHHPKGCSLAGQWNWYEDHKRQTQRRNVLLSILRDAIGESPTLTKLSTDVLADQLRKILLSKGYHILVDDIWEARFCDDLRCCFHGALSYRYARGPKKGPTTSIYCTQLYLPFLQEVVSKARTCDLLMATTLPVTPGA